MTPDNYDGIRISWCILQKQPEISEDPWKVVSLELLMDGSSEKSPFKLVYLFVKTLKVMVSARKMWPELNFGPRNVAPRHNVTIWELGR